VEKGVNEKLKGNPPKDSEINGAPDFGAALTKAFNQKG